MHNFMDINMSYAHPRYSLLLGSKSPSRQMLLSQAHIPFTLVNQDANERECGWTLPLSQLVASIAHRKMDHVLLPAGIQRDQICFVMTADTLSQDLDGTLQGKPADRADAIAKIRSARAGSRVATAFCLDRRVWDGVAWTVAERIQQVVTAQYTFNIPDAWIDIYFEKSIGLNTAGAVAAEDFGAQFLHVINGSYATLLGLPMHEVREALEKIGFWK